MPANVEVRLDQVGQQGRHVGVRGMNLVHNQQTAGQQAVAHVGVPYLQCPHQGLINGAHRNRCGQESFAGFGRPALMRRSLIRAIRPQDLKVRQALPSVAIRAFVAGQGSNHRRRFSLAACEQILGELQCAPVQLRCSHPCRQREIQTVNLPGVKQVRESP